MRRALACEAATEFEWEAHGLPLISMGALATCFEDMSDNEIAAIDDLDVWPQEVDDTDGFFKVSLKRKLCDVDFAVLDRDDCHDPIVANDCPQLERCKEEYFDDLTLGQFYERIRAGLSDVKHILSDTPPGCLEEVRTLMYEVRDRWEQLRAVIRSPPRFNFCKATEIADVIDFVKSQVTERQSCSQDLCRWCEGIETCFIGFDELDEEEQAFLVSDVAEDMLCQLPDIEYCMEAFEDLILEKRE